MSHNLLHPELLTVSELFDHDTVYTVPIYQRNYAWRAPQIEQLISDIQDAVARQESNYFLGNLVVTPRENQRKDFAVIDGQQRLTTLYLLLTFLENAGSSPWGHHQGRLQHASRARATEALRRLPGMASVRDSAPMVALKTGAFDDSTLPALQALGLAVESVEPMSLEDIFVTTVRGSNA